MFENIKELLLKKPVLDDELKHELYLNYIKVRDTSDENRNFNPEDELFLLFNKKNDTEIQRECNGIIFERKTNKIVAACQNDFENEFPEDIDNFISAEYCEDGTVIRLYNHKGIWMTCTKKCINAKTSYWSSLKSFNDMFWEIFGNTKFDITNLDKNCTYLFSLLHMDNILVVRHDKNELVYLGSINNDTCEFDSDSQFKLFECNENIKLPKSLSLTMDDVKHIKEIHLNKDLTVPVVDACVGTDDIVNDMENLNVEVVSEVNTNVKVINTVTKYFNRTKRGIILKFTGNRMFKIDFNEFVFMQNIRGNEPLIRNRYLRLLNDDDSLKILVNYYPEHHFVFSMIYHNLLVVCNDIYLMYRNTHIKHLTRIDESHLYFITIRQLHGQYKKTNVPITKMDVFLKLKGYNLFVLKKLLRWTDGPSIQH